MSDDPVPTYKRFVGATGSTVTTDTASPVATVSQDDWGLPDQIEKMSRKELRRRIRGLIELFGVPDAGKLTRRAACSSSSSLRNISRRSWRAGTRTGRPGGSSS